MLLVFLLSCAKLTTPQALMDNENCLLSLKQKLEENNCIELSYLTKDYSDSLLRCNKDELDRRNIWDTNWFRVSPIEVVYTPIEAAFIEEHTICVDNIWRIESYEPSDLVFENKQ